MVTRFAHLAAIAVAACVAAVAGFGSLPPASAAADAPAAEEAPVAAAVIAYGEAGEKLFVADLQRHQLQPVGEPGATPNQPVWSPDGKRLAYRVEDRILVWDGSAPARVVFTGTGGAPYVFSPDGLILAVALRQEIALVPLDPAKAVQRFPIGGGGEVGDIRWSIDGSAMVALRSPPGPRASERSEIVRIGLADRSSIATPARGVVRILGQRPNGDLVLAKAIRGGEQAVALTPSGTLAPLRPEVPDLYLLAYLRASDRLVLASSGEDPGDQARIWLAAPGNAPARRWLARYPKFGEISFSPGGRWGLFVVRAGGRWPGGSVYLVEAGAEDARRVLAATAVRTFTSPAPRPR